MALTDFVVCMVVAILSAAFLFSGLWWAALFAALFFLLLIVNIVLMHIHSPRPVFMVEFTEPEAEEE